MSKTDIFKILSFFRCLLILFGMRRIRRLWLRVNTLWLSNAKPGCTEHAPILSKMINVIVFNQLTDVRDFLYSLRFYGFCSNTFSYNHFFSVFVIHVHRHNENINTHALIWRKPCCIPFAESTIRVIAESLINHNPHISDTVIQCTCTYLKYVHTVQHFCHTIRFKLLEFANTNAFISTCSWNKAWYVLWLLDKVISFLSCQLYLKDYKSKPEKTFGTNVQTNCIMVVYWFNQTLLDIQQSVYIMLQKRNLMMNMSLLNTFIRKSIIIIRNG